MRKTLTILLPVLLLSSGAWAADLGAMPLAAHRATYALKLSTAKDGGVQAATGSMTYAFIDACEGWSTQQRLDMTVTNGDGQDIHMLSDYSTFESKDGLHMRFRMKQMTDAAVTSDVEGESTLDGPGLKGHATYVLPKAETLPLAPGTLFPTAHTEALLAAAVDGKHFLALPLFDGTSEKGPEYSSIVMGGWSPTSTADTKRPSLARLPSGKFHIAFFDHGPDSIEPTYEVSMRYFGNGVADDLLMNFGDFSMQGTLTEFKLAPASCG